MHHCEVDCEVGGGVCGGVWVGEGGGRGGTQTRPQEGKERGVVCVVGWRRGGASTCSRRKGCGVCGGVEGVREGGVGGWKHLQQPCRAVEAAAQAAVGHRAQLGLALAVGLCLVEAVLQEEAEGAAGHHQQRAERERARRVAHLRRGGVKGGAKRSRGTDDEAEGHEAEDGEEGGYREAEESVHGAAGGGMMRGSADHTSARKRGTSTSGKAKGKKSGQQRKKRHKYGGSGT